MEDLYVVEFDPYTERHYIRDHVKTCREKWEKAEETIRVVVERLDAFVRLKKVDTISHVGDLLLCKVDFAVPGMNESPKSSGRRCIVVADRSNYRARVLLVYSKKHVGGQHETVWWKGHIKSNFPEYEVLCN